VFDFNSPDGGRRDPVYALLAALLPPLLPLARAEAARGNALMVKVVCQILSHAVHFDVAPALREPAVFAQWLPLLVEVLRTPLPMSAPGGDVVLQAWKCKKWALAVFQKMFTSLASTAVYKAAASGDAGASAAAASAGKGKKKKGAAKAAAKPQDPFKVYFNVHVMPAMLEACFVLTKTVAPQWAALNAAPQVALAQTPVATAAGRVVAFAIEVLTAALSVGAAYQMLQPHINELVHECFLPLVRLSRSDYELFVHEVRPTRGKISHNQCVCVYVCVCI